MIQLASLKVKVKSLSFVSDSANPWAIQARILEWVAFPFSRGSSQPKPGIKPRSPALQVDSLPAEPQGKPKNTGVGSLSLLQLIFLTQKFSEVNSIRNTGEDLFYYHSKWLEKQLLNKVLQKNMFYIITVIKHNLGINSYSRFADLWQVETHQVTMYLLTLCTPRLSFKL